MSSDQNTPEDGQRVVTVTQAATREGVSRMTILRRLASGELRGRMVGGRWLIAAGPEQRQDDGGQR